MERSTLVAVAAVLVAPLITATTAAENPPKRSAELAVLGKFIGTWDLETTVQLPRQKPFTAKSISYRTWSKGGKYILFEDRSGKENEQHLPLTYDAGAKAYRGVVISGTGPGVVSATWEAETSTMNFVIEYADGTIYRGSHRFIREGYAEASGRITDEAGKVLLELSWKQTRRQS